MWHRDFIAECLPDSFTFKRVERFVISLTVCIAVSKPEYFSSVFAFSIAVCVAFDITIELPDYTSFGVAKRVVLHNVQRAGPRQLRRRL